MKQDSKQGGGDQKNGIIQVKKIKGLEEVKREKVVHTQKTIQDGKYFKEKLKKGKMRKFQEHYMA